MTNIKRYTAAFVAVLCACALAFSLIGCGQKEDPANDALVGTWPAVGTSSRGFDHITYSSTTEGELVINPDSTFEIHLADMEYSIFTGTWSRDADDETLYHLQEEDTSWTAAISTTDHGSYVFLNNVDHDEIVLVYALDDEAIASIDELANNAAEINGAGQAGKPTLTDSFANGQTATSDRPSPKNECNAAIQMYLESGAFSRLGLLERLEADSFPTASAEKAIDNANIDWNAQAVRMAQEMLSIQSMPYAELVNALEFKGFTPEEAAYGVDNCGQELQ